MHAGTETQSTGEPSGQEEKRETKPWSPEEKQIFYEGFSKHYKKYALIHEMLPSRSCTQIRQCFYREMKRIQSLLGESQSIVNWDDKDNLLCIFNSYATLLRGGNDVQKTMKSKKKAWIRFVMSRYIERLRHSIDKINKRHALEASRKREQEESAKEKSRQPKKSMTVSLTNDSKTSNAKDSLFQPLSLPRHVNGLPKETMIVRLVPATDVLDGALRSCGYTPLLELTVRTTFTVRMLFAHLRTRWSKFCQRVQGVFRLTIASSNTTGVWVESRVPSGESLHMSPNVVLSDTNSLLSNRMEKAAGTSEHAYGNSVSNSMEQLKALAGLSDVLKLSIDYCVVSHSRRIRTFFMSPLLPSEAPERFVELVGATQTDVFRRDVFGEASAEMKPQRGRRPRKEGPKRRGTRKRADEGGSSLLTSFTDALPFINSSSQGSSLQDPFEVPPLPEMAVVPQDMMQDVSPNVMQNMPPNVMQDVSPNAMQNVSPNVMQNMSPNVMQNVSPNMPQGETDAEGRQEDNGNTGPTFDNYLQILNSNGWLEKEQSMLGKSENAGGDLFGSPMMIAPPSFDTNSRGRNGILPDVNSKLSNLFSRMTQPDTTSWQGGFSLPPLSPLPATSLKSRTGNEVSFSNSSLFQKDDSLCFPFPLDNPL